MTTIPFGSVDPISASFPKIGNFTLSSSFVSVGLTLRWPALYVYIDDAAGGAASQDGTTVGIPIPGKTWTCVWERSEKATGDAAAALWLRASAASATCYFATFLPTALSLIPARQHAYASTGLTAAWSATAIGASPVDAESVAVPSTTYLSAMYVSLAGLAGVTMLYWYLAHDASGADPVTGIDSTAIAFEIGMAGVMIDVAALWMRYTRRGGSGPYLCAYVDAGTPTIIVKLEFQSSAFE